MSKNKLYNQSYFVKRILDAGFFVTRLNIKFEPNDTRKWMILVNGRDIQYKHNIFILCFKNDSTKECQFKIQGFNTRDLVLKTMSMNVIISILQSIISEDVNEDSLSSETEDSNDEE